MSPYRRIPILTWVRANERRGARRSYAWINSFELMLAVSALVGGVVNIVNPETSAHSSLGELFGYLALLWAGANVIAGAAIIVGLLRPSMRLEVAGLCLLAGSIAGQAVAITAERGWIGVAIAVFYIGWAAAAVIRARLVIRLSEIIDFEERTRRIRLDEPLEEPREPWLKGGDA